MSPEPAKYMNRRSAAAHLQKKWGMRCAEQTLAKYATLGSGPTFQKFGRHVVYLETELDDWACARLSWPMKSTSDSSSYRRHVPVVGDDHHPETPTEKPEFNSDFKRR